MKALFAVLLCIALFAAACIKDPFGSAYPKRPRIATVKGIPGYGDSLTISYNHYGNPDSLNLHRGNFSYASWIFLYDNKGRMTDYFNPYAPNPLSDPLFDTWQQFHYDALGRIAYDTIWEFGIVGPGPKPIPYGANLHHRYATTFQYDHLNRIVYEEIHFGYDDPGYIKIYYNYDAAGNLAVINRDVRGEDFSSDTLYYDDKPNFRALNKIWQFLDRDYSINNRLPVLTYNAKGYPTSIGNASNATFGTLSFTTLQLEYN